MYISIQAQTLYTVLLLFYFKVNEMKQSIYFKTKTLNGRYQEKLGVPQGALLRPK